MNSVEQAYVQGFVQKCSEANVNPDALAKFAQANITYGNAPATTGSTIGRLAAGVPVGGLMSALSPKQMVGLNIPAPTGDERGAFKAKAQGGQPGAKPMPQPNPIVANLAAKKDLLQ